MFDNKPAKENKEILTGQAAVDLAVKYLDYGYRTEKQMADYLKKKGADSAAVDYAINKLKEYNYLNDAAYCKGYIESGMLKSGAYKLRADLKRKGADNAEIDKALKSIDEDAQVAAACSLAEKRARGQVIDRPFLQKLSRFLAGRGFSWDVIKRAVRHVSDNSEDIEQEFDE